MKFKDGEKGMRVKALTNSCMYDKGDIFTISGFIYGNNFLFEEIGYNHQPCKFKPVEEFIYNDNFGKYKVKVLIRVNEPTTGAKTVGIRYKNRNGKMANKFVNPIKLETVRNKNNLKVGDKFKTHINRKFKVLFVGYDTYSKETTYFSEQIDGPTEGFITAIDASKIEEIIYD